MATSYPTLYVVDKSADTITLCSLFYPEGTDLSTEEAEAAALVSAREILFTVSKGSAGWETTSSVYAETALTDYVISSGTYANGDMPLPDIPFIEYSISVPSDWAAEKSGDWENEVYYTFQKDSATNLYAGPSRVMSFMDDIFLSTEYDITTLTFGDYTVKLQIIESEDGHCYYFFNIPVDESYCQIIGLSPVYSEEQQDEFFEIVKTFKII